MLILNYMQITLNCIDKTDKAMADDLKEEQRFMDIIEEILKVSCFSSHRCLQYA